MIFPMEGKSDPFKKKNKKSGIKRKVGKAFFLVSSLSCGFVSDKTVAVVSW